jgi:cyclophilin family peptidyl-prolyl cis-trans isomerase
MANETTYALVSSLINPVREAALMYAQNNLVMPQTVTTLTDQTGMMTRNFSQYNSGTVYVGLGETADLDSYTQEFTRSALSSITPREVGTQFFITDRRLESDDVMNVMADLGTHINYTVFAQVEAHLATLMASFTGGTIGTAGSVMTWDNIYKARAILRATGIPGPFKVVLHEYSYLKLATAANIAGLTNAAPLTIRDNIQNNYYVGSNGDMDFYTISTAAIAAGTAVKTGIFNSGALAWDIRRPLRIEPERDPSRRGIEMNVTMVYGEAVVRPTYGVTLLGDASTPT